MAKIQDKLLLILIGILIIIIFFQRQCTKTVQVKGDEIIHTDTSFQVKIDSFLHTEFTVRWDTLELHDSFYIPSPNYDILLKQYNDLVLAHTRLGIYQDSIQFDSSGISFKVQITDSVRFNTLHSAKYKYTYKIPTVTNNIIKKTRQLYVGGNINSSKEFDFQNINAGLLLKNKKDQIYGLNVGVTSTGKIVYGISSYWKIKF